MAPQYVTVFPNGVLRKGSHDMKFTFAYPAVFKRDEDGRLLVGFPDFPRAHTDGANANEAMPEAIDYLVSSIAFALTDEASVLKRSRLSAERDLFLSLNGSSAN